MEQKTNILLIEDNADDAGLTIRALRKNNFNNTLLHFNNGEDALDFIFGKGQYQQRDINDMPGLILLDLKMPKVGGIEVLKKVKADPRTRNIPVVMLTSSNENNDIRQCYQLGANSYIVKPVEFGGFTKTVGSLAEYWLQINQHP